MGKKQGSGPTVMVVDDDDDLRELVCVALTREGYEVIAASDAFEGLELLKEQKPVLALLDVMMPGMDGLEMLARLRQRNENMHVIIMTALTTPETATSALHEQACDFLAKPFDMDQLLSAVNTAFELRQQNLTIEVLSARPEWIELRVPCTRIAIEPLERMMMQLKTDLPSAIREGVTYAFREMLRNAIEYGGKDDPSQYVEVSYLRSSRMIQYRIKDPGEGFSLESLFPPAGPIAAIFNPADDAAHHASAREEMGLRPGGFGIFIASKVVDEILYNEHHNEVVLIKYLDGSG